MQKNLENILNALLQTVELLEEEMKQETDLKDLTPKQIHCLELIKGLSNPTLTELSKRLGITKPSVSVMMDRLERNSFIKRVASDRDRRAAHVHLTEKGEKAAQLHTELHRRISELLTDGLTDSEKQILEVLLSKSVGGISTKLGYC